ncbi:MAG: hypothetical protein CM15mP10_1840 [Actinomycetota bacterium]|nr:MAG: hypothetical protein CM15mP10_1840 [Actinomycetota bacterium]
MKIVSWNMNKRKNGTWNYLINNINPDVALIQNLLPLVIILKIFIYRSRCKKKP